MKYLRISFLVIVVLFVLDWNEILEIRDRILKDWAYLSILMFPPCLLFTELLFSKTKNQYWKLLWFSIFCLAWFNFKDFIYEDNPWKSQSIILENRNHTNHKVEYQTKSFDCLIGERTAEVFHLSKFFMIILSKDTDWKNYPELDWKRVNKETNDLDLK